MQRSKLNAERAYNFSFYLDKNGKYIALIGSDEFPNIRTENIVYINKTKNDAVLAALSAAQDAAAVADVLAKKGRIWDYSMNFITVRILAKKPKS